MITMLCWLEGYVRWELGLLAAVGYRLDLTRCVASGQKADLCLCKSKVRRCSGASSGGCFCQPYACLPKFRVVFTAPSMIGLQG